MVALSQIRCLLTRRPAPFPPTFWVSWPTTRHVTEKPLYASSRDLAFSNIFFLSPTAKGKIRFFLETLSTPRWYDANRWRRAAPRGRWPLPSQNDCDSRSPPAALFIPTFRLRATMSDTSAGRMAFALSFIASSPYLIGVALSDLVFPRPEMADGMATKASSPLVVFSSIGNFHILFRRLP